MLGSRFALQSSTVDIDVNNGLNLNGLSSAIIGGLTGTGSLNLGVTQLSVGTSGADTSYSGVFSGTTGGLTKVGGGTLTLSGGGTMDNIGVSAGGVNITGGTLNLTDTNTAINAAGGTLTLSGGAINTNANAISRAFDRGVDHRYRPGDHAERRFRPGSADSGGTLNALNGAAVNSAYTIKPA